MEMSSLVDKLYSVVLSCHISGNATRRVCPIIFHVHYGQVEAKMPVQLPEPGIMPGQPTALSAGVRAWIQGTACRGLTLEIARKMVIPPS